MGNAVWQTLQARPVCREKLGIPRLSDASYRRIQSGTPARATAGSDSPTKSSRRRRIIEPSREKDSCNHASRIMKDFGRLYDGSLQPSLHSAPMQGARDGVATARNVAPPPRRARALSLAPRMKARTLRCREPRDPPSPGACDALEAPARLTLARCL